MISRECTFAITFATGSRFQPTTTHGNSEWHWIMKASTLTTQSLTIEPAAAACRQRNFKKSPLTCSPHATAFHNYITPSFTFSLFSSTITPLASLPPTSIPSFNHFSTLLTVIPLHAQLGVEKLDTSHVGGYHSFSDFSLSHTLLHILNSFLVIEF